MVSASIACTRSPDHPAPAPASTSGRPTRPDGKTGSMLDVSTTMTRPKPFEDSGVALCDDSESRFARADTCSSTVSTVSFVDSSDDALDAPDARDALHSDSGFFPASPLPAEEHPVQLLTPRGRTGRLNPAALAQLPAATLTVAGPCSWMPPPVHSPVSITSTSETADEGLASPSPFSVGLQLPTLDGDGGPDGPAAPVFQSTEFVPDKNHQSVRLKSVARRNPLFQEEDGDDTGLLRDRSSTTAAAAADAATAKAESIVAYRQRVASVARRWKISLADASDLCDMVDEKDGSGVPTNALRARTSSAPPALRSAWAAPPLARVVAKPRSRQVAVRLLAVPLVDKTESCEAHRLYELDICDAVTGESYQTVSFRYSTLRNAMRGRDKLWAGAVARQFPRRGAFKDYTFNKYNACTRGESIREFLETVLNADDDGAIIGAKQLHTALGVDRYGQRALLEVAVARSGAAVFCPGSSGGGIILSPGRGRRGATNQPRPQSTQSMPG